ncbi:hypothetical protein MHBO_003967, partial [Bonamia ostreae]
MINYKISLSSQILINPLKEIKKKKIYLGSYIELIQSNTDKERYVDELLGIVEYLLLCEQKDKIKDYENIGLLKIIILFKSKKILKTTTKLIIMINYKKNGTFANSNFLK